MAAAPDLTRRRRVAALASMLGASAIIGSFSLGHGDGGVVVVLLAAMLAVAGVGITAKQLVLQTLSRGLAWMLAAPLGLVLVLESIRGHLPPWWMFGLVGTLTSALLLSRPALHSKEAHAQFHPHRFRRTLLAGSTATAATAYFTGGMSLQSLIHGDLLDAGTIAFGLLTVALVAVSTAVVRMRSWGILLGAALSATLLVLAPIIGGGAGIGSVMLAAPMLLLHLMPILLARWGAEGTPIRLPVDVESAPVRYRVASLDEREAAIDAEREELPQERRQVHV